MLLIIVFLIVIFIIRTEKGSFDEVVLSKLDDGIIDEISISYSTKGSRLNYMSSNNEVIDNLITYLKTLNLKQTYSESNGFEDLVYIIFLHILYEDYRREIIMMHISSKKDINISFDQNAKNKYKIINDEIDYNKLNEIISMMEKQ